MEVGESDPEREWLRISAGGESGEEIRTVVDEVEVYEASFMLPDEAEFFRSRWTSTAAASSKDDFLLCWRFSSLELREQDEDEDELLGRLRCADDEDEDEDDLDFAAAELGLRRSSWGWSSHSSEGKYISSVSR